MKGEAGCGGDQRKPLSSGDVAEGVIAALVLTSGAACEAGFQWWEPILFSAFGAAVALVRRRAR